MSKTYSFSTGTHGRSRRFLTISSFRSACSASSVASSSRVACHSSRVPILCSGDVLGSSLLKVYEFRYARTNIDLDDEACSAIMERYELATKREAVNFALRTVAERSWTLKAAGRLRGSG